jgi:hypothetical protein
MPLDSGISPALFADDVAGVADVADVDKYLEQTTTSYP